MAQTRIGFVGAGSVAARHARTLTTFDDVVLAAVTDVTPGAAEALGLPVYPSLEAMLDDVALDAAYVCVPPFAHGLPERMLIDAGVPFFVEKPLARDLDTAEALATEVAAVGLVTATGYHWRNLEVVERARELLAGSPARLAIAAWLDKVPSPGWWIRRDASGGQTIEQTTHVLDLLLHLMGDVVQVHAVAARTARPAFPDADVDDVTAATLRFASGAVGSVTSTCLLAAKHRAGVELFSDGRRMELSETTLSVGDDLYEDPGLAKRRVDRDFVDAVQGRADRVRAPYAVALRTHRLGCALTRSADEGRPVDLSPAA